MIDVLDEMLRTLFLNEVPDLKVPAAAAVIPEQVRFDPPDDSFASYLTTLFVNTPGGAVNPPALNAYLADVRENRHLRTNDRQRRIADHAAFDEPPPARIDLHYLITAWLPGKPSLANEPAPREQLLLYEVTAALLRTAPVNASRVYADPAAAGVPVPLRDLDLPTTVLPVDGFPKLAEFWGAMGRPARWKPAVYLVVTLPVFYPELEAGPLVTTKLTSFLQDTGGSADTLVQIGGVVRTAAGAVVPGAWVRLETTAGAALAVTESNDLGRFDFDGLRAGSYVVRARKQGMPPTFAPIDVPSPAGGYEVRFP